MPLKYYKEKQQMAIQIRQCANARTWLTSEQVSQTAELPYRSLMRLVEKGVFRPARDNAERQKPSLRWTEEQVILVSIASELWTHKFTIERIREVVATICDRVSGFTTETFLLADREMGGVVNLLDREQLYTIPSLLRKGTIIVPITPDS